MKYEVILTDAAETPIEYKKNRQKHKRLIKTGRTKDIHKFHKIRKLKKENKRSLAKQEK